MSLQKYVFGQSLYELNIEFDYSKKRGTGYRLAGIDICSPEASSDACSSKPSMAPRTVNVRGSLDVSPQVDDSQSATHSFIRSILSLSAYDGPNDIPTIRQSLARLAQHALSLEQELSTLKETPNGKDGDPNNQAAPKTSAIPTVSTSPSTNDSDDIALSEHLKRLTIESGHNRFFGSSSTIMLIRTALEMQRASSGGRTTDFPHFSINLRPTFWTRHPVSVF
jgi:hypothetical protein